MLKALSSKENKGKDNVSFVFQAEKARVKLLTRFKKDTSKAGDEDNQVMAEILNSVQFDDSAHKQDQDYYVEVL